MLGGLRAVVAATLGAGEIGTSAVESRGMLKAKQTRRFAKFRRIRVTVSTVRKNSASSACFVKTYR